MSEILERKCTKNFQAICPKTIFLPGTSGVGKTKLVQQMACQYSLGLIHVSPANLLSKYIGESHINISLMFDYLKEQIVLSKSILLCNWNKYICKLFVILYV